MSFGQELKDFVSGFKTGASIVSEGRRSKAYKDQVDAYTADKKGLSDAQEKAKQGAGAPTAKSIDGAPEAKQAIPTELNNPENNGKQVAAPLPPSRPDDSALQASAPDRRADMPSPGAIPVESDQAARNAVLGSDGQSAFNRSVNRTLQFEGGYNPNDAGKGATNHGINGASNGLSTEQVRNLTPDQAKQLYKTRYWDAIGGDQLAAKNPMLAHVAFDTAVNAGPGKAKQLIEQSGGDPNKLLDLRKGFYDSLIENDPGKFGKYSKAWYNRIDALRQDVNGGKWTGNYATTGLPGSTEDGNGSIDPGGMGSIPPLHDRAPQAPGQPGGNGDDTPEGLKMRPAEERYRNPYKDVLGMSEGGRVPAYEDGGFVDRQEDLHAMGAIPDDVMAANQPGQAPAQGAPAQAPQQAQSQAGGPIHDGLMFLQEHFGLSGSQGAMPDEHRQAAVQRFSKGEGASPEDFHQVVNTIDPDGKMTEAYRNLAGINGVYEYYLNKGDYQKARSAAGAMILSAQQIAAKYGDRAVQRVKAGDVAGAAQELSKGYNYVMDGHEVQADPRTGTYVQRDAKTGKVTAQGRFTAEDVLQQALRLKDGSGYYEHLINAAAASKPMTAAQQQRQQNAQQAGALAASFDSAVGGGGGAPAVQQAGGEGEAPQQAIPETPETAPAQAAAPVEPPRPGQAIPTTPGSTNAPVPPAEPSPQASADPEVTPGGNEGEQVSQADLPSENAAPMEGDKAGRDAAVGGAEPTPGQRPRQYQPSGRDVTQPAEYPIPAPRLPAEAAKVLQQMQQMGPEGQRLAKQKYDQWKATAYKEWEAGRNDWLKRQGEYARDDRKSALDADRAKDLEVTRSHLQDRSFDHQEAMRRQTNEQQAKMQREREEFSQKQQNERAEAQRKHEIRMERNKLRTPDDFDYDDDTKVAKVQDTLTGLHAEMTGKKPEEVAKELGKNNLGAMRDSAINVIRYNKIPLDTAAKVVLGMTHIDPDKPDAVGYKIEPVEDAPDDRVKVVFPKGALIPSIYLPQSSVDALDVIRGQQAKKWKDEAPKRADEARAKTQKEMEDFTERDMVRLRDEKAAEQGQHNVQAVKDWWSKDVAPETPRRKYKWTEGRSALPVDN